MATMTTAVPRPKRKTPVADSDSVTFSIRLPGAVYNALDAIATREDRYLNAQIVRALREWLASQETQP